MNYLSAQNIQNISMEISRGITVHPTAIAYIQALITPYAQMLDTAVDTESIIKWIPKGFT